MLLQTIKRDYTVLAYWSLCVCSVQQKKNTFFFTSIGKKIIFTLLRTWSFFTKNVSFVRSFVRPELKIDISEWDSQYRKLACRALAYPSPTYEDSHLFSWLKKTSYFPVRTPFLYTILPNASFLSFLSPPHGREGYYFFGPRKCAHTHTHTSAEKTSCLPFVLLIITKKAGRTSNALLHVIFTCTKESWNYPFKKKQILRYQKKWKIDNLFGACDEVTYRKTRYSVCVWGKKTGRNNSNTVRQKKIVFKIVHFFGLSQKFGYPHSMQTVDWRTNRVKPWPIPPVEVLWDDTWYPCEKTRSLSSHSVGGLGTIRFIAHTISHIFSIWFEGNWPRPGKNFGLLIGADFVIRSVIERTICACWSIIGGPKILAGDGEEIQHAREKNDGMKQAGDDHDEKTFY